MGDVKEGPFEDAIKGLFQHFFPVDALKNQKRFMRRNIHKPKPSQKFDDNEISEIIEALAPTQWSGTLKVQNFDINAHSSIELVEFLEWLETAEQIWHNASGQKSTTSQQNDSQNTGSKQNAANTTNSHTNSNSKRSDQSSRDQKRRANTNLESHESGACPLHGNDHKMDDCRTIQGWVTEKKDEWRKINDSKKKFKSNNYKGHRNPGEDSNFAIKKTTKTKHKHNVKHRQHKQTSERKRKHDTYSYVSCGAAFPTTTNANC
eukprot:scaffold141308_cov53-Attheya_sp.AAC.3